MRLAILDYGVGNLHSLANGLSQAGADVRVVTDPRRILDADGVVLPGVGAFAPAAARLAIWRQALRAALVAGLPCLAICNRSSTLSNPDSRARSYVISAIVIGVIESTTM